MKRRTVFLAGGAAALAGVAAVRCAAVPDAPKSPAAWGPDAYFGAPGRYTAVVSVQTGTVRHPARAQLCGTNVQWVDGGDGLLPDTGTAFVPSVLEQVRKLAPSVIRYPGGSNSEVYNWRDGIGPLVKRGASEHFHRKEKQVVRFGTAEFLELCAATQADAMITVNASTLTAQDAADWVSLTNVTRLRGGGGELLPTVPLWEVGNEPYLSEKQRPETWIEPQAYATRADAFIAAMRKVDPTIKIGVPLRSDKYSSGMEGTPHQGYNAAVLKGVRNRYDYVAVHDAYMPFSFLRMPGAQELYAALMGASETVRDDLDATQRQIADLTGVHNMPMALTEYSAFVTIGLGTDGYLASPAGALYVADVLCLLASRPDVMMANHWSLIGNWFFGCMDSRGNARPAYDVLRLMRTLLRGNVVASRVEQSARFTSPALGAARATSGLDAVVTLATHDGTATRVLVLNKSPHATADTRISVDTPAAGRWTLKLWSTRLAFGDADGGNSYAMSETAVDASGGSLSFALPPSSIALLQSPGASVTTRGNA